MVSDPINSLPAISIKASKRIGKTMRSWWRTSRTDKSLKEIADWINPYLQGWINYYGKFYKSGLYKLLFRLNLRLTIWVTRKFKRFKNHMRRANFWLGGIYKSTPNLFAHWKFGIKPPQSKLRATG